MFQLHVVLDGAKDWRDIAPPWIAAVASLITVVVVVFIARNQNKLQTKLAEMSLEQKNRQMKMDLFDRRYAVFTDLLDFMSYVLRENGRIELAGAGQYRHFRESMEKAEMLFGNDVNQYLADVDETVRNFWASVCKLDQAIATGDMEAINKNHLLLERLSGDLWSQRKGMFHPYLDLSHNR